MLAELGAVLANVPQGSRAADYREAILQRNVLGKTTDSTRQKSLRHLRELYALDEATLIFGLLRNGADRKCSRMSLPLLASPNEIEHTTADSVPFGARPEQARFIAGKVQRRRIG